MHLFTRLSGVALLFALFNPLAFATNGINLIGFGTESTLMGGADIAVARDTSALNTNPAGLTQIHGQAFDGFASGCAPLTLPTRIVSVTKSTPTMNTLFWAAAVMPHRSIRCHVPQGLVCSAKAAQAGCLKTSTPHSATATI
ncbi:hypothetical protein B0F87_101616 [Methylobacter tundripaludum]|uniref:Long-chain fatty acid transport protein n=1 Tax=Methylobacter tundripaludum TaxID=173365 RepID=A0A2S6HL66_9GAMM|nr:hypothetical protein [Methylobacter tundripaludum]PPK78234.1 hypothetical protein B0F87_101616 [Methylobacter tundripaludum]